MSALRLIYDKGQRVGPDPVDYYVYLWRGGKIDRYVGKGKGDQWRTHLKTSANDSNQLKMRYFRRYKDKIACFIIVENLTEVDAGDRECAEIDRRGLKKNGTGTLLNDRRGSAIYGPRGKRAFTDLPVPTQRWMIRKRTDPADRHTAARRSCVDWQPEEIGMPGGGIHRSLLSATWRGGDHRKVARQRT